MSVFNDVKKQDLERLHEYGFYSVPIIREYETARMQSKAATLVLFDSGKLVVQGKPDDVTPVSDIIKKLSIGIRAEATQFKETHGTIIGSDEVLKGDTFGGIVVAAVKADEEARRKLIELGVADSKSLADEEIQLLAPRIEKVVAFEVKNMYPEEYNDFNGTVTQLLNKLHKECYYYLKPGRHIVDKYPGCTVGDVSETKAESKYVEVAAASVLARYHGLRQLSDLSERAGFIVPKGSTRVHGALLELKKRRLRPHQFVKLHFRNVKKILEL